MDLARRLHSFNLNDNQETGKINVFINNALKRLKPADRELN
jgi:superfamily II RNA helicase